jgi:uncharacterized protein (DUF2236 family)
MDSLRDRSGHVSQADSDSLISSVRRIVTERAGSNPQAGIFGPESISWTINRESALFLGAGRAALLQLAHPWVATALEQHSSLMNKPIERFHNTFRIVFTMIFGSLDQATRAARHLYNLHTHIQGELTQDVSAYRRGSHYEANQIPALRWVFASLVESAVLAYECALAPLQPEELAAYYGESKILARMFGLPESAMPPDWPSFLAYCREMEQSDELGVTETAATMGRGLLAGAGSWVRPPQRYRDLTASWLPVRFRKAFGLDPGAKRPSSRRLAALYQRLPSALRFVGPWHEAQDRLAGKGPGLVARTGNRFWIGQYLMPFGDGNAPFG